MKFLVKKKIMGSVKYNGKEMGPFMVVEKKDDELAALIAQKLVELKKIPENNGLVEVRSNKRKKINRRSEDV